MSESIVAEMQELQRASVGELQRRWVEVFGESSRSRNRTFLWKRLAWELQARVYGRLPQSALDRLHELASESAASLRPPRGAMAAVEQLAGAPRAATHGPMRDPRIPPPGSTIVKRYHGRDLRVSVHDDHFEHDGQSFDSLSALARHITDAKSGINGLLFFGLTRRARRP